MKQKQFFLAASLALLPVVLSAQPTDPSRMVPLPDTQKGNPPAAKDALGMLRLPAGFQATLFASEPDVRQPIGMTFDDRGRLWVAECNTYAERQVNYDLKLSDRVVVFEDVDGDGRHDRRTVFWDQGKRLTSVEVGFGGVWVLCAPQLLFLPDRNGDDVPDGPPEVVLDGWDADAIRHNIVNGLKWGPDGWLYGRHGIQATSFVGPPGTPRSARTALNCCIWRWHPTRKVFEVVCQGTTNPWGLDWDAHGQGFFINTVIGHLWHVIPGAHYRRMYGEDLNRHVYEPIEQHADHFHWDTKTPWHQARDAKGEHDLRGGGHAHSGLMIYQGNDWPKEYRGGMFTLNFHGRRINHDALHRHGSGYVGKHAPDPIASADPWFRGIELGYGPDGGVFVLDWSDFGECHENDGVHRNSGRIYKIFQGKGARSTVKNVAALQDEELVRLLRHENEWFARAARRNLQERAAANKDLKSTVAELRRMVAAEKNVVHRLRALWSLHGMERTPPDFLRPLLEDSEEHVRAWAVRLLTDFGAPDAESLRIFVRRAAMEPSALVRLHLASALQRLPAGKRGDLAAALLARAEDAADHNLPLMLWYGVEPLVPTDPERAVALARSSRIPLVRRLITRRLAEDLAERPKPVEDLVAYAAATQGSRRDVLQGLSEALRGWRKAPPPPSWRKAQAEFAGDDDKMVRALARELGVVFGDGRALEEVRRISLDRNAPPDQRRAAVRNLVDARPKDLLPLLHQLLGDRDTAGASLKGLAVLDDPGTAKVVLGRYPHLRAEDRAEALVTLASRPEYALALLRAVEKGHIPRGDLPAYLARQIAGYGSKELTTMLTRVWGEVRETPAQQKEQLLQWKKTLVPDYLAKADLGAGRLLFAKSCAACHRLFGEGQVVGPDLTGSDRRNLDYLLENILTPSAVVPADFRMSVLEMKNGRVINGVLGARTPQTLTVQTPTEKLVLDRAEIESIQPTPQSLMPDGLLNGLTPTQVRDLFGYLMAERPVFSAPVIRSGR